MKKLSLAPLFVFILGLAIALLSLILMTGREDLSIEKQTLAHAYELKDGIEREFLWSENVLRGIEGLFHASQDVSRQEFHTFCSSTIHKGIPLHLVEWQPKVSSKERASYERAARKDDLKSFQFFEIDENGKEIAAKKREYHFPVFYTYSPNPSDQAVGLDLAFSPLRMESKYESMKSGHPILSETFDVILKGTEKKSLGFGNVKKNLVKSSFSRKIPFKLGSRDWSLIVYPTKSFVNKEKKKLPWVVFGLILLIITGLSYYLYFSSKNVEKLNSYEIQLQQKQRLESLGVLSSGIAHEFNNILHCITLAIENFKDFRDEAERGENIEISLEYCNKGRNLVRQLLSFSRKDSVSHEKLLLSNEIHKTLSFLEPSLPKGIKIDVSIDDKDDQPFLINSNHISQILINLINNAVLCP